jgi:Bifunctional DNA primase/polymerase, N-terminal
MQTKLNDALEYAACGFFIVPFTSDSFGATPLVSPTKASRNPSKLREWWARWPNADVGCPLDKNHLVIVEVNGDAGQRLFDKLIAQGKFSPSTASAQSGDSTRHYFRASRKMKFKSVQIGNGAVKIFAGKAVHVLPPIASGAGAL